MRVKSHTQSLYPMIPVMSVVLVVLLLSSFVLGSESSSSKTLKFRAILISHGDPRPAYQHEVLDLEKLSAGIPAFDREQTGRGVSLAPSLDAKLDYLENQIRELHKEGYNALVWMGENEFWYPSCHAILHHKKFPEARELSPEDNEKAIAYMKDVFAIGKKYGMRNLLYSLSIWYTSAFGKAHNLDHEMLVSMTMHISHNLGWVGGYKNCGIRNELTNAYTQAIFAEALELYPDLDGFYSPMGECVPGQKSSFFKETILPALKISGRNPIVIVSQWMIPMEEYIRDIADPKIYDNLWLGFHGYNSEQITDAKPYPSLVRWAEGVNRPTIADVYPANIQYFPFNSPKFAWEITHEMKKIDNFVGFKYWEFSVPQLSYLFRHGLAYYAASNEPYSPKPWLDILDERYGDRVAAEHFLAAFDISARIIPEICALLFTGNDVYPRELRIPYNFMLDDTYPFSWTTARVRGKPIVPVWFYARYVAKNPDVYRDNDGSDPLRNHFRQESIWRAEGGGEYDTIPPAHVAKIREMGDKCIEHANLALKTVKKNQDDARRIRDFMKAYQLMTHYYEKKVLTAIEAIVYSHSRNPKDRERAEGLADETLTAYIKAANFMQENLAQPMRDIYHRPYQDTFKRLDLPLLIEAEKEEREKLGDIFNWKCD